MDVVVDLVHPAEHETTVFLGTALLQHPLNSPVQAFVLLEFEIRFPVVVQAILKDALSQSWAVLETIIGSHEATSDSSQRKRFVGRVPFFRRLNLEVRVFNQKEFHLTHYTVVGQRVFGWDIQILVEAADVLVTLLLEQKFQDTVDVEVVRNYLSLAAEDGLCFFIIHEASSVHHLVLELFELI